MSKKEVVDAVAQEVDATLQFDFSKTILGFNGKPMLFMEVQGEPPVERSMGEMAADLLINLSTISTTPKEKLRAYGLACAITNNPEKPLSVEDVMLVRTAVEKRASAADQPLHGSVFAAMTEFFGFDWDK